MSKKKVSKFRLALNGIGSLGVAIFCLPIGIPGLIGVIFGSLRLGSDPDGGDKVLGVQLLCVVLGAFALASLIDTVIAWRRLSRA